MQATPNRTTRRTRRPVAAGILVAAALIAAPLAVAGTGDALLEGKRNGTTVSETEIIGNMTAKTGKGGYVTRQSNVRSGANAGGAAVYGCRAAVGGTLAGSAPCLRGSNLAGGNAFEFATTTGVAGLISVGDPLQPNPGRPFVTNATGVATGLNADKVDGKDAADLQGAQGPQGPAGLQGVPGTKGDQGDAGSDGSARAYAQVSRAAGGTFVATRTSGFSGVTRPAVGVYCLQVSPATGIAVGTNPSVPTVASVEFGNSPGAVAPSVQPRGSNVSCPSGSLELRTFEGAAASNDVSFTVLVP